MTKAQLQAELTRALERIAELEEGASDPERELADDPGQILADRLRELIAACTLFPETDIPDFYNALDAYDVAKARL